MNAVAAAAIAQATPTSPWHPTSAPETDAFFLTDIPIKPATARPSSIASSSNP